MPDDGSTQDDGSTWPTPKFRFEVKWDATVMQFQEVSGLEVETQLIEYRSSNSPEFSVIKMPGIKKSSNVILKKGFVPNNSQFGEWLNQIKMNTVKRTTITITLQDESGAPTMTWTLSNAWPTKISSSDLKSDGNEVVIETIEIVHEGLTITNG
jgi:phage tail-like protein